jgi:cobalt-zinc-cadmium efflux system membrane fusion protein
MQPTLTQSVPSDAPHPGAHLEEPKPPAKPEQRSPDRPARWGVALGVGLCLVAGAALALTRAAPAAQQEESKIKADKEGVTLSDGAPQWEYVKLAVAELAPALPPMPVPGRVGFDELRTASLGVPLAGRIEQVRVRLGDAVKPGDKLFSVRSRDFADLEKEVATARESVGVKQRLRDRAKELFALNAVPEKDVLAAEAELKEARLVLKAAEAKQSSLAVAPGGDNLYWVRAPRQGMVVSLDVYESQEVSRERSEPLMRISDTSEVLVTGDVLEADAADLAEGGEAVIHTRDGTERKGTIQHIASVVDPQRQTLGVRIRADNKDGALRPNSFVEVTLLPHGDIRRVHVDEDAIVSDGKRSTVFVLKDPNRLEKLEVRPGRRRDGLVEIREGMTAGTRYVAKGALLLLNQVDLAG